jgi:hypothetical protein
MIIGLLQVVLHLTLKTPNLMMTKMKITRLTKPVMIAMRSPLNLRKESGLHLLAERIRVKNQKLQEDIGCRIN